MSGTALDALDPGIRRTVRAVAGFVHNCVAHPLLFWTGDARWAVWLHDETAGIASSRRSGLPQKTSCSRMLPRRRISASCPSISAIKMATVKLLRLKPSEPATAGH